MKPSVLHGLGLSIWSTLGESNAIVPVMESAHGKAASLDALQEANTPDFEVECQVAYWHVTNLLTFVCQINSMLDISLEALVSVMSEDHLRFVDLEGYRHFRHNYLGCTCWILFSVRGSFGCDIRITCGVLTDGCVRFV